MSQMFRRQTAPHRKRCITTTRFILLLVIVSAYLLLNCFASENAKGWQNCEIFLAPSKVSGGGWGVFANRNFAENDFIEIAPLFVPFPEGSDLIVNSVLENYVYGYQRDETRYDVVVMGMAMWYNHHPVEPNVQWFTIGVEPSPQQLSSTKAVGFLARRYIQAGEELFSTYVQRDGGSKWFADRQISMSIPKKEHSQIAKGDELDQASTSFCSKIYAGIGQPTWRDRVRRPKNDYQYDHLLERLASLDAGFDNAVAKVSLKEGDRIEISPSLILPRDFVVGTALSPLVFCWEDLEKETHQKQLYRLRQSGHLSLEVRDPNQESKRVDQFLLFKDIVLLPVAGSIGMVRRVGKQQQHPDNSNIANCRMDIQPSVSSIESNQGNAGIVLELVATSTIEVGQVLILDIPRGGSIQEHTVLRDELKRTGQPIGDMHNILDEREEKTEEL